MLLIVLMSGVHYVVEINAYYNSDNSFPFRLFTIVLDINRHFLLYLYHFVIHQYQLCSFVVNS